jgi:hypothetical protein
MFGNDWTQELVENVVRIFGHKNNEGWQYAINGYIEFTLDVIRNQKFFEANGHYKWSRLEEVKSKYYDNENHMIKSYLPGIYLSHYLWPHHFKLLSFFREEVLKTLQDPCLFYEVGIGPGLYSKELLLAFPKIYGKGFDISTHSASFTSNVLESFGLLDRYEVKLGNIFTMQLPQERADFVVSQGVLEHVEQPERFCQILYEMSIGKAYITAAINAGQTDHIYLLRSPEEVEKMLKGVGWKILKRQAEYAYEGMPKEVTPCVAGFFCKH